MGTALQTLLVSASLLGVDPQPALPPAVHAKAAQPKGPVKEVLRIPLSEIVRNQERAWTWDENSASRVGFCAAFDPQAELWIKLKDRGATAAHKLSDFEAGVEEDFPDGRTRVVLENGYLRAFPVHSPQTPQAHVSVPSLVRGLYNAAEHVLFTPVDYALVYEDGGAVPSSLSLIREDDAGRFYISYHSKAELSQIVWLVSIDGTMYGARLQGEDLVFYSEPTPGASVPAAGRPAPVVKVR
jgi:hypothetical protein